MKYCPKCDTSKNKLEFYNNKSTHDGLGSYCKPCNREVVSLFQKTDKGKIVKAKAQRKFHSTEYGRKKKQEWEKAWRQTEKGRTYDTAKSLKRYYSDPEHYRLKATAQRHGCPVGVLKQVLERDKVCQLCSTGKDLQFDHIYPVSQGGKGSIENLQLLCGNCNNFKSNNLFLPDGGMLLIGKQQVTLK